MLGLVRQILPTFLLIILLAGCATSRGSLDIEAPKVPNPESADTVKIVEVVDKRVFEADPPKPSIPSLKNDEIKDPRITKRAVARKRNSFGAALGDILLPEGRTVEQLTRDALASALKEKGYRVLSEGDPGYGKATPVSAEIRQFWAWMNPGFWQISLTYRADIMLTGDWPLNGKKRAVQGNASYAGMMASSNEWRTVIGQGIRDLIRNLKEMLSPPSSQKIARQDGT